jgi:hypothetical protein
MSCCGWRRTTYGKPVHDVGGGRVRENPATRLFLAGDWDASPDLLGVRLVPPQPAKRVGQDGSSVYAAMGPFAENELVVVTGEFQRGRHLLVGQGPVAMFVVQVVGSPLKKDANRLRRRLANQGGIDMAATNVHKAADVAEHFAKGVGTLPGDRPGTNPAGTDPGNGPAIRIAGQPVLLADLRQDLFQEKSGVLIRQRVLFKSSIAGCGSPTRLFGQRVAAMPRIDEDSDDHRKLASMDQVVQHDGRAE